jgi:hypothetical protein
VLKSAGTLILLLPLVAGQAWLWPMGLRAARTGALALPERYEWSEGVNQRGRVRYAWKPLAAADAVRMGWGALASASLLGLWTAATLLHGRAGWGNLRRPLALVSALLVGLALLLLLPPWKSREFPLAGGCWASVMLVGAVQLASGPAERRFGKARMQSLNRLAGGAALLGSAVFFGWSAFWGLAIGLLVILVAAVHVDVLKAPAPRLVDGRSAPLEGRGAPGGLRSRPDPPR